MTGLAKLFYVVVFSVAIVWWLLVHFFMEPTLDQKEREAQEQSSLFGGG